MAGTFVLLLARFHLVCLVKKSYYGAVGIRVLQCCLLRFFFHHDMTIGIHMAFVLHWMSLMRSTLSVFMFNFAAYLLNAKKKLNAKNIQNVVKKYIY